MTAKLLLQSVNDNEELTENERRIVALQDQNRLDKMIGYCKTTHCLRGYILDYFGQEQDKRCGNCGNCQTEFIQRDITLEAQKILSCVKRVSDRLGYSVGATLIIRTLCGSSERRITDLGLDKLSTYGLLKGVLRPQIREYMEHLEAEGYLYTDTSHGSVRLTAKAGDVLFKGASVKMAVTEQAPTGKRQRKKKVSADENTENDLLTALRALRFRLAQKENVPAYIIFSNATLSDMAAKAPKNHKDFLEVSGVGEVKAARYADAFIEEIKKHSSVGI